MAHVYAPCSLCGGEVMSKLIRHTYHWNGQLFIFEDVPAGVCVQCGEVYFTAETIKMMEKIVLSKIRPKRTIRVPVYTYAEAVMA
ncbi:MAG: type II toxin-antitoxin system MqsA family antitoxin [Chloroflexi bacterium]|nr:type II toxin-antitoxin system MqsA family antitoxin [Chloroflexota bacterium]